MQLNFRIVFVSVIPYLCKRVHFKTHDAFRIAAISRSQYHMNIFWRTLDTKWRLVCYQNVRMNKNGKRDIKICMFHPSIIFAKLSVKLLTNCIFLNRLES